MELNQIKYFLNLAETLNFTEAARLSGISQPSLTKSIRRLEEELGGPLLYRDGKDTRLTALGRDIQIEFMRVASLFEEIRELADHSVTGRRVTLTIGVATTVAPVAFADFWAKVLNQLPMIELNFQPLLAGENENEVLSGKYDLCLLTNPPSPNLKLTTVPLFNETVKLALTPGHPLARTEMVTPGQMAAEPYLDRVHCEFRTQLIKHFMDRNIVMRPRIQSEREDWVQSLVASGLGVCALPERSVVVNGIILKPVEGLDLSRDPTLVAVSGSGNPREVRQILQMAREHDW